MKIALSRTKGNSSERRKTKMSHRFHLWHRHVHRYRKKRAKRRPPPSVKPSHAGRNFEDSYWLFSRFDRDLRERSQSSVRRYRDRGHVTGTALSASSVCHGPVCADSRVFSRPSSYGKIKSIGPHVSPKIRFSSWNVGRARPYRLPVVTFAVSKARSFYIRM